jgi:hypothetical protein
MMSSAIDPASRAKICRFVNWSSRIATSGIFSIDGGAENYWL